MPEASEGLREVMYEMIAEVEKLSVWARATGEDTSQAMFAVYRKYVPQFEGQSTVVMLALMGSAWAYGRDQMGKIIKGIDDA